MQAEMDVHAVAYTVSHGHRREDGAMAEPKGCGARELAGGHRLVGGLRRCLRGDGHLELLLAVFGQEAVGLSPAARSAATRVSPKRPGRAMRRGYKRGRQLLRPGIDELLLEGGDEVQPACGIERGDGAA